MNNPCQRLWRGIGAASHYARWSWMFGGFGFRSRLSSPALLTNSGRVRIGKRVSIKKGSRIEVVSDTGAIEIGDGTSIQLNFHCGAANKVVIGKNVLIAGKVYISDHDHVYDHSELPPRLCRNLISSPVIIEDGVWLGEGCAVLKGVKIGRRSVVGANAVVTKSVPAGCVVCGVPAKIVRRILINDTAT